MITINAKGRVVALMTMPLILLVVAISTIGSAAANDAPVQSIITDGFWDTETLLSSTYYDSYGRQDYTRSEVDNIVTAKYGYDSIGRNIWTSARKGERV